MTAYVLKQTDKRGGIFLVETVNNDKPSDTVFGIATVKPNRALRKCRIRKLLVEYFVGDATVVLTIPRSCGFCNRMTYCVDDFILQIIEKTIQSSEATENRFTLP